MKKKKIFYQCTDRNCNTILSINDEAIRMQIEKHKPRVEQQENGTFKIIIPKDKLKIFCPKCGRSMFRRVIE